MTFGPDNIEYDLCKNVSQCLLLCVIVGQGIYPPPAR
ncbi:unnamed protein product, partial [Rotaria sp. Silwood2]